jgi:Lar family restriction alleviation protein
MSNELKSCPFCGAAARRLTIGDDEPNNAGGDVIVCTACQASSHVEFGRKENLVSRWNTRTSLATQPATSQERDDADRANGVGQDELVTGLKRALQHPAGDHDGWTDAGMEDAFFRWPVIVNALNEALAATPTPPTLSADLRMLVEALRPLADLYLTGSEPDDECAIDASDFPNAGHVRAARAALAQVKAS